MRNTKTYKQLIKHLFTFWVALHTLNYSVDIDSVLFSQASYSTTEECYQNKVESFLEIFISLVFDEQFDGFEDNPFSQNESKSFVAKVFVNLPSLQIISDDVEKECQFKEQLVFYYIGQNYPTPTVDIIPPPPRVA